MTNGRGHWVVTDGKAAPTLGTGGTDTVNLVAVKQIRLSEASRQTCCTLK